MKTLFRILVGLALVAAVGCGKKSNVHGTITRDGQPLVWKSEGGHLLVIFIPEDREADSNVYRAETDRDTGAYRIASIPAGRYRVAVQQFDEKHNDALRHTYDPHATTLVYEVTGDNQRIDVDLPKDLPGGGRK
jgi:hypothetical protein